MKVKNFIAADINQALQQIKQELGPDAVILSQQPTAGGVQVTAAIDEELDFSFDEQEEFKEVNTKEFFDETELRRALDYHGVLEEVQYRILSYCREAVRADPSVSEAGALQQALQKVFCFVPLLKSPNRMQMFMGTPGSGKSTAIAKAATQAKLQGVTSAIVSTDNLRAGANQQLKAFAAILDVDFYFYKEPQALFKFLQDEASAYDRVFIDTPGINPFIAREVEKVAAFADTFKGDKILTADAGRNVWEAMEVAEIFKNLGAGMVLPTRLDLTRRIGGILSIAGGLDMALCAASVSSSIANGLAPVNAAALAGLILG